MPRQVTLVCGPPCGGKTHYVTDHAQPGDLIACIDQLAQQAGSPTAHNHTGSHYGNAEKQYWVLCHRIAAASSGTAWVIRCIPECDDRATFARALKATHTVVLLPTRAVAHQRALHRDPNPLATIRAIDSWYNRYQPSRLDTVVRN